MIGRALVHACALAVFGAVALSVTAPAGGTTAACTPGVRTVDGRTARVFCGPAKATVHIGAKTISFSGGACDKALGLYSLNIGTAFPGGSTSKLPYFGITIEKAKPGTYRRQTLSFRTGGVSRSSFADITLKTLHSGTFSGRLISGGTVTGSFSC